MSHASGWASMAESGSLAWLNILRAFYRTFGRRASVASFARGQASFIDVNSIPTSAVERVEILLSGASAQYGADAARH